MLALSVWSMIQMCVLEIGFGSLLIKPCLKGWPDQLIPRNVHIIPPWVLLLHHVFVIRCGSHKGTAFHVLIIFTRLHEPLLPVGDSWYKEKIREINEEEGLIESWSQCVYSCHTPREDKPAHSFCSFCITLSHSCIVNYLIRHLFIEVLSRSTLLINYTVSLEDVLFLHKPIRSLSVEKLVTFISGETDHSDEIEAITLSKIILSNTRSTLESVYSATKRWAFDCPNSCYEAEKQNKSGVKDKGKSIYSGDQHSLLWIFQRMFLRSNPRTLNMLI